MSEETSDIASSGGNPYFLAFGCVAAFRRVAPLSNWNQIPVGSAQKVFAATVAPIKAAKITPLIS